MWKLEIPKHIESKFNPYAVIFNKGTTGEIMMQIFLDYDCELNIPIMISTNPNLEVYTICKQFINMLRQYKYKSINKLIIDGENKQVDGWDKVQQMKSLMKNYSLINLNNQNIPIRIREPKIDITIQRKLYLIPHTNEVQWIRAFSQKTNFYAPSVLLGESQMIESIPMWNPDNHMFYPKIFQEKISQLLTACFTKEPQKKHPYLSLLNHDLFLHIMSYIIKTEFNHPYYYMSFV